MKDQFVIKQIHKETQKQIIARTILENLPEWFGIPESIDEYVTESATMPFFACFDKAEAVGFLSIKIHFKASAEIYVMGIDRNYHRKGIGKALISKCETYAKRHGVEFLQVKTLSELHKDENYAKTRAFYASCGFTPLECFKTLWDVHNPCLLLIKYIKE